MALVISIYDVRKIYAWADSSPMKMVSEIDLDQEKTCLPPMHTGQPVFRLIEQRQGKILGQIANIKLSLCSPIGVFATCCRLSLLIENEKILMT